MAARANSMTNCDIPSYPVVVWPWMAASPHVLTLASLSLWKIDLLFVRRIIVEALILVAAGAY
jgi:hypothetical protein